MSIAPGWRGWVVCLWLEKQAADSCVFMRSGWESQLWSADLQHKQERLCKFDLPSINPLWIFPIRGRIIGNPHPHIPALVFSDEPYKDWLWPSHKQHDAAFIIVNERVMFDGISWLHDWGQSWIHRVKSKNQIVQWLIVLMSTFQLPSKVQRTSDQWDKRLSE